MSKDQSRVFLISHEYLDKNDYGDKKTPEDRLLDDHPCCDLLTEKDFDIIAESLKSFLLTSKKKKGIEVTLKKIISVRRNRSSCAFFDDEIPYQKGKECDGDAIYFASWSSAHYCKDHVEEIIKRSKLEDVEEEQVRLEDFELEENCNVCGSFKSYCSHY